MDFARQYRLCDALDATGRYRQANDKRRTIRAAQLEQRKAVRHRALEALTRRNFDGMVAATQRLPVDATLEQMRLI